MTTLTINAAWHSFAPPCAWATAALTSLISAVHRKCVESRPFEGDLHYAFIGDGMCEVTFSLLFSSAVSADSLLGKEVLTFSVPAATKVAIRRISM